jgi:hypothetical protein
MVQGRGRPVRGTWALDAEMGKIPRGGIHWQYDCGKFNAGTATKAEVNLLNELRIDDMRSRARLDCNEYRVSRPARATDGLWVRISSGSKPKEHDHLEKPCFWSALVYQSGSLDTCDSKRPDAHPQPPASHCDEENSRLVRESKVDPELRVHESSDAIL